MLRAKTTEELDDTEKSGQTFQLYVADGIIRVLNEGAPARGKGRKLTNDLLAGNGKIIPS